MYLCMKERGRERHAELNGFELAHKFAYTSHTLAGGSHESPRIWCAEQISRTGALAVEKVSPTGWKRILVDRDVSLSEYTIQFGFKRIHFILKRIVKAEKN